MSQACSVSAKRVYGLARVCTVWGVPRSSVYAHRKRETGEAPPTRKRGPQGACTDQELTDHCRRVIKASPWVGEGYRKVWARLRHAGIRTSPRRVLRVMREGGLLAQQRSERRRGPQAHDRSITPARPDELWGTDMTGTLTGEGHAAVFFVIDHCTAECLGIHAARRGTRIEALEALRGAVRERFGVFDAEVAQGVGLRHDHGSQFVSHTYQDELRFLGIRSTPSFVREPQGNGCAERFVRTLKEQLLWLRRFDTVEDLDQALAAFRKLYNDAWLIQRHGHVSPREHHRRLVRDARAAA